ncbi:MAG: bifunctional oligoribonuclease/PAP phosphatase NrnA [Proteobacteria bacterium]|nr:bifunctional oligoribonuclease/PAP phosphatase NrnA [Desulfobacterales bacterium]MBL7101366.1 bifunctional oligoribonuclease/PAP phosphatase NrnA [Desulfobacteraceae bacterium]MBU0733068.1 bifunctional oligoribonuclease/PAP phosphatase NrnA [Pseudomonadota bacterium]MBL7171578.1 bifunctional oligoribonuclease/PAP phosphatase NrnA [Desulfobacteraceae bacterium]MBU0990118.1 bifunctional oligoribonuclease/PAP phosphatase NrnA [Pseudomonadota bacterium]
MMTSPDRIAAVLSDGNRFLLMTHKDPDADGIGSMLALGKSLMDAGKEVVLFAHEPVQPPLDLLKGASEIVTKLDFERGFDAAVALDCAVKGRLGGVGNHRPLINIDHHESNDFFGDLNLIETGSSSTGELVFKVIEAGGFPVGRDVAENIFAAIQTDTGSFRYGNTTAEALRIAADLMERGANPWEISRKMMDSYSLPRLRLLEMALGTIEFHHEGRVAMMILSREMFRRAGAQQMDSERFVDYPRFVFGVELGVLIRETDENDYKFSLRSNTQLNAARLASRFGGGGHVRAAGFRSQGSVNSVKDGFLKEAGRFLDGACG